MGITKFLLRKKCRDSEELSYPNYDFELSDEDAEFIREKVLGYVRSARPGTATIESIVETSNAKKRRTKK